MVVAYLDPISLLDNGGHDLNVPHRNIALHLSSRVLRQPPAVESHLDFVWGGDGGDGAGAVDGFDGGTDGEGEGLNERSEGLGGEFGGGLGRRGR